ncbi:MAG: UxaA family hydrolase, partial [Rhodospirillaceae bacterium]|nr:UxaA family hydrolase [Rhodospirillaceae bacterium]
MIEVGHNSGNKLVVRLHPADNVVTSRLDMLANISIDDEQVSSKSEIPSGHKIATRLIQSGEEIRKYDQVIGFATAEISPGEHVHVHNVEMRDFARDYQFCEGVT